MGRSRTGEAISAKRVTSAARQRLRRFIDAAEQRGDLDCWRRGRAVLGYIERRRVVNLAAEAAVTRGSVNRWLQWYEALGVDGLLTGISPGAAPRLSEQQRAELSALVEKGPLAAGYQSGVWTGPMIGDLIEQRFGVRYHAHYIPELLHQLGFSVQRPRKRLARADVEAQEYWLRERFPAIKKSEGVPRRRDVRRRGQVGVQPRVDTFGMRKTAHVYGAVSIERRPYSLSAVRRVLIACPHALMVLPRRVVVHRRPHERRLAPAGRQPARPEAPIRTS